MGTSANPEAVIALALCAAEDTVAENNPNYKAAHALNERAYHIWSINRDDLKCEKCGKPAWGVLSGYDGLWIYCWQHYTSQLETYGDEDQFFVIPEEWRPERAPEDRPGGVNNPKRSINRVPRPMAPPRPLVGGDLATAINLGRKGDRATVSVRGMGDLRDEYVKYISSVVGLPKARGEEST